MYTQSAQATASHCQNVRQNCRQQFLHAREMLRELAAQADDAPEKNRIEALIDTLDRNYLRTISSR